MTSDLKISPALSLSLDFVTKTAAILAQRRKGKTYTAAVLAEELVAVRIPWVALDPTGAWWGLLAAANGVDPGLPVVVIGGQHGHLPLDPDGGRFIGDMVLEHPGYYVIDLSLVGTKEAERRFAYAFADRLYRRKMQPGMDFPMHLFVDEADMFVPQERENGDNLMLGAFQSIVRRGGLHGLGTTLISQRPALVNKNVLTQLDMLILLRLVAGNDQDYLDKNYVKRAGSAEQRAELMGSLASLRLGEAWVWEPGSEPPLFERVQIRQRHTFNSSATPRAGETRVEPQRLADVDLAAIKEAMAETIEKAKAEDPKELRRRIAELERQLATRPVETVTVTERVEIIPGELIAVVNKARRDLLAAADRLVATSAEIGEAEDRANARMSPQSDDRQDVPRTRPASDTPPAVERPRPAQRPDRTERRKPSRPAVSRAAAATGDVQLGKTERTILAVLVQHGERTHRQLALQSGYSAKASTIRVALGKLRRLGLVEPTAPIRATAAGVDALGDYEPLPTGRDLLDYWRNELDGTSCRVLDAMLPLYPGDTTKDEIASLTGYSPDASTIRVALGKLRRLELVDGWRISDDFARSIGRA